MLVRKNLLSDLLKAEAIVPTSSDKLVSTFGNSLRFFFLSFPGKGNERYITLRVVEILSSASISGLIVEIASFAKVYCRSKSSSIKK